MELRYIKTKQCPDCGCTDIVAEELDTLYHQISEHSCGQRWETRRFACGYAVKYTPNFHAEEQESECYTVKDKKIVEYDKFAQEVQKYIGTLEYSEEFKNLMKNHIQNSKYRIRI